MNTKKLLRALEILPTGEISAEHDVLYIGGPAPATLPKDQVQSLDDIGCRWDEDMESWFFFT